YALERRLFDGERQVTVLDGDNIRLGLCKDLGFSIQEKSEHLRRVAEVAKILNQAGLICVCAFVAPDAVVRERMKEAIGKDRFLEVYLSVPLEHCKSGRAKEYYEKAENGELYDVPGISAPYDIPTNPDLILNSHELSVDDCVDRVIRLL
ncbi:MAG: adenylyl-sulfate kinase, partial [Spirochaetota bacterium]|nr:adenylyl-sulfate kinase [Spirochaetota bacterium]